MPGRVPLNTAKFTNSPDFNYQVVSGITGSGVFRQLSYINSGGTTRTTSSSDLWNMVQLVGNSLVTIPAGISANDGDEILFVNTTGTISFTTSGGATLLSDSLYTVYAERPARLIYAGADNWILAGAKTAYSESAVYDCCGAQQNALYTLGVFSPVAVAYNDAYGSEVYTFAGAGGVCDIGGTGYSIQSGTVTESPCVTVNFDNAYTFYLPPLYEGTMLYTYANINILNDWEILGVPFKDSVVNDVYHCNTANAASGTYYRSADMYGAWLPVCLTNGIVTATLPC